MEVEVDDDDDDEVEVDVDDDGGDDAHSWIFRFQSVELNWILAIENKGVKTMRKWRSAVFSSES